MNDNVIVVPENRNLTQLDENTARDVLIALANPRNSHIELFKSPIQVALKDIDELQRRVQSKLEQLRVDNNCIVLKTLISLDKDRNFEVVGWRQFSKFDWQRSEKTKAIVLKWEFMYQKDEHSPPGELHVLSVRITEELNPMHMLRAALSKDREEAERMEITMCPLVCEVDYVDGLLSRELVHLVSEWQKSLRRPAPLSGIGNALQAHRVLILKSIDFSLEMLIPLAYVSAIYAWMHSTMQEPLTAKYLSLVAVFLMLFTLVNKFSNRFSTWTARRLDSYLDRMGRFPVFELTSGDQNNLTAAVSKITNSTLKFWGTTALSFAINVASAVFCFYVLQLH